MPIGLKRYYGRNDLHFLTFSCYRKLTLLGSGGARSFFLQTLGEMRGRYELRVAGYVVMPNHVHLLIEEPAGRELSEVVSVLKQRVSRDLRSEFQPSVAFSECGAALERFWQPRFHDFNVYSGRKVREKLDYMHANPVKRGLVEHPRERIWSSYLFYEEGKAAVLEVDSVW